MCYKQACGKAIMYKHTIPQIICKGEWISTGNSNEPSIKGI